MPEPAHDALEALRARLAETKAQAEQLAADVAAAAGEASGGGAGRAGGDGATGEDGGAAGEDGGAAGGGPGGPTGTGPDVQAILALVEALRELVPPELQQQLADVTRQILLLLRALIDFWVDRLEPPAERPAAPAEPAVEDIPVR